MKMIRRRKGLDRARVTRWEEEQISVRLDILSDKLLSLFDGSVSLIDLFCI
jgi:hypothetical protein